MNDSISEFLDEDQLAKWLGLSKACIQRWRYTAQGPRFLKLGTGKHAAIRYRRADIESWLAERAVGGAA